MIRIKDEHIVIRMVDVNVKRRRGRPNLRWGDACKIYDRDGAEGGQHNKQGIMEGEDKQVTPDDGTSQGRRRMHALEC